MSRRPRSRVATEALQIAREHLQDRGYQILDDAPKQRPLDLVASSDELIVFSTVKTLPVASSRSDYATHRQRVDMRKAAAKWLSAHAEIAGSRQLRFDSIAVTISDTGRLVRLDHIEALY